MPKIKLVVVDGCPCPASIAPYIKRVLDKAGQSANSIYRGDDAADLLHRHGKRTQREIHRDMPGISNPSGYSSHELRSDGGAPLPEWRVGVDSGANTQHDRDAIERAARSFGWVAEHPYNRGVELHHWNFKKRPRPKNPAQAYHLVRERARLPRT